MEVQSDWLTIPAESGEMSVYVARPKAPGKYPAVVHFHSFVGISEYRLEAVRRLAGEGFTVVLPDLFHRRGRRIFYQLPDKENDAVTAAGSLSFFDMAIDSRLAINVARGQPNTDSHRIGVLGYGMGGTVAYIAAASQKDIAAAAIFYSRNIVTATTSARRPISPLFLVEEISCPVLFVSATADPNPTPTDVDVIAALFKKHGKVLERKTYEGDPPAGHAFMEQDIPGVHHDRASTWGWGVQLDFLKRRLSTPT